MEMSPEVHLKESERNTGNLRLPLLRPTDVHGTRSLARSTRLFAVFFIYVQPAVCRLSIFDNRSSLLDLSVIFSASLCRLSYT